ncbi:MAG: Uncharacterised protein [Rhodobiaceae bacterium UBA7378]|nr:MAG: Uncharacterised protein [Rhodobiaceae bacterium UBA7378]
MTQEIHEPGSNDAHAAYATADRQDSVGMRALAGLFLLEHEFRRVPDQPQLARLIVNRLNRFAPYDCAVFWTCSRAGRIYNVTISGVEPGKDARQILTWGTQVARWLARSGLGNAQIQPDMIDAQKKLTDWPSNIAKSGLYVPLTGHDARLRGGILLLRAAPWAQPVRVMMDQLGEAAAYTVRALELGVHGRKSRRVSWVGLACAAALLAVLVGSFFIPMPVNVDVPARLAMAPPTDAPPGPAQIDLLVPPAGAMALSPGTRLRIRHLNVDYELEVEHVTNWLVGIFDDRKVRARLVSSPDGLAPPAFDRLTIENAHTPLAFYMMRGPVRSMRDYLGLPTGR